MTIEQLVRFFAEISAAQGEAIELLGTTKANRLVTRMVAVRDELARRPDDGLAALATLFSHPNVWARYNSANMLLDQMAATARPVIQANAESNDFPIAGHAGMTLSFFDGNLSDLVSRQRNS